MKNLLYWCLILVICTLSIAAQSEIKLKNISVEDHGFSLDVPENIESSSDYEGNQIDYNFNSDDFELFITSTIITSKSDEYNQFYSKELIKMASADKARVTPLVINRIAVRKYEFVDKEGFYEKILIFNDKNRQFIIRSLSKSKKNPAVDKIFSSLKLESSRKFSARLKKFKYPTLTKSDEKYGVPNVSFNPSGQGNSGGIGEGRGQGDGNGFGFGPGYGSGSGGQGSGGGSGSRIDSSPTAPIEPGTMPLKILSKPRPGYTDQARKNNINGKVLLRVQFLANGQIGSVSPVTALGYGLTEKAIAAARAIKFEPPKKQGKPYSVVKLVEYVFSIY